LQCISSWLGIHVWIFVTAIIGEKRCTSPWKWNSCRWVPNVLMFYHMPGDTFIRGNEMSFTFWFLFSTLSLWTICISLLNPNNTVCSLNMTPTIFIFWRIHFSYDMTYDMSKVLYSFVVQEIVLGLLMYALQFCACAFHPFRNLFIFFRIQFLLDTFKVNFSGILEWLVFKDFTRWFRFKNFVELIFMLVFKCCIWIQFAHVC
jgi:hypothetical protein